ncbi:hypothetical protein K7G98_02075 [Saccharothrix sp. MB29]|nr:hypothetical protein [Saccharothrix sp. MB29]
MGERAGQGRGVVVAPKSAGAACPTTGTSMPARSISRLILSAVSSVAVS